MTSVVCGKSRSIGVRISCRQVGDGPDVILIHGLAANSAFWQFDVVETLSRSHRVTTFDLRGHGYSGITNTGYRPSDLAEDLHDLMDELDIGRATLVGHSYGGTVALSFVERYSDRVERMVLADTRVHALQPTNYAIDWPNAATALPLLKSIGIEFPADESDSGIWLLEELAKPEWRDKREVLRGSPLYMPFGPWSGGCRSADKWLKLLRTTQARSQFRVSGGPDRTGLRQIAQPVLIFYGSHTTLHSSYMGLVDLLPNGTPAVAENAGHFFPASQPGVFSERVLKFLEETASEIPRAPLYGNSGASNFTRLNSIRR